jgi:hypothetical protein
MAYPAALCNTTTTWRHTAMHSCDVTTYKVPQAISLACTLILYAQDCSHLVAAAATTAGSLTSYDASSVSCILTSPSLSSVLSSSSSPSSSLLSTRSTVSLRIGLRKSDEARGLLLLLLYPSLLTLAASVYEPCADASLMMSCFTATRYPRLSARRKLLEKSCSFGHKSDSLYVGYTGLCVSACKSRFLK